MPKDIHDIGATPIVTVSSGPSLDPRHFYSTTNSTTYRPHHLTTQSSRNLLDSRSINGLSKIDLRSVRGNPIPSFNRKERTSYVKNVGPYVEYNKSVDETPGKFQITEDPYLTVTVDHYKPPPKPKDYLKNNPGMGLAPMVDSGFTRLPKYRVTEVEGMDLKALEKISEMKSNYSSTTPNNNSNNTHGSHSTNGEGVEERLKFKVPQIDKSHILPSETAYTEDVSHIPNLGNPDVFTESERFKRVPFLTPSSFAIAHPSLRAKHRLKNEPTLMSEDGYTRSTRPQDPMQYTSDNGHHIFLPNSNSQYQYQNPNSSSSKKDPAKTLNEGVGGLFDNHPSLKLDERLLKPKEMENLKHKDIAEWVHRSDPAAQKSLSRYNRWKILPCIHI
jgi:hypothetical protein